MDNTWLWDISRAAAVVATVAYTVTMVWGLGIVARSPSFRPAGRAIDYHRLVNTIGLLAMLLHFFTVFFDKFAKLDAGSLIFLNGSLGIKLGFVAGYLALILPFTSKAARMPLVLTMGMNGCKQLFPIS